ncbi:MAG: UDP-3-O-(3-hydroxymyristoyl)glucosamine N-acyltransferase [Acidobacteriota bacterium]|nr:UDP-3-O-(3-hydroxymyristoyl)glucosamine N-acyltransferase [Acidobacteriota bacterium]
MPELTVAQLAELCGGQAEGRADLVLSGANTIENATLSDLSFAESRKAFETAASSNAGCLLVPLSFQQTGPWALIRVESPRTAFVQALAALYPKRQPAPSIHPTALIASSASIGRECFVGAYATVGERASIGTGCSVGAGCRIGNDVIIGEKTTLHPNVVIYDGVRIGGRVILHSGCVIGADGFGFTFAGDHYEKFPQVGSVEIGDDVEIGANCCVDRAALGTTRIGEGTKLDNLVHVAHNCLIGKHVVVAAQTGFSGSVTVGDYAVIGGQAGIGEKARIDAKAIVGGKSGVLTSQRIAAGEPVWGIPARPLRQHLQGLAHVAKLADTHREIRSLKKRVAALETAQEQQP